MTSQHARCLNFSFLICRPLLSVFGGDEDEDKPKRKLIPLTYTEEEKLAMQETQVSHSSSTWQPHSTVGGLL